MDRANRTRKIIVLLKKSYGDADCALHFRKPYELLIATILSAQCTDKRVNMVTETLFRKHRSVQDFAEAPLAGLEQDIRSTGFFRQKSRWIQAACRKLLTDFRGKVPGTMDELLSLPGVARKTANVVMGTAFKIASGVVVDTHVGRISRRLGLTRNLDPVKVERDLTKILQKKDWIWFSHALISHGRKICRAVNPLCIDCALNKICPSSQV